MDAQNTGTRPGATEDEIQQAARILQRLEAGFLPFPIFLEAARLVTFSIIELIPYRRRADGGVDVLLLKLEADDLLWPGMWHNPGSVLRPTDNSPEDAFDRIYAEELGLPSRADTPVFLGPLHHKTRRGSESANVYAVELTQTPPKGTFFDLKQLPAGTIESHVQVIQMAERIDR